MKTIWKKGWKVISKVRQSVSTMVDKGGRYYPVNKVVGSSLNCGPLCVFRCRKLARKFACSGEKIVKCLYLPSKHNRIWYMSTRGIHSTLVSDCPNGTLLADKVKCLE